MLEKAMPILHRILSMELDEGSQAEGAEILHKFTDMCQPIPGETTPHQQNQKILYNFGLVIFLFNLYNVLAVVICGSDGYSALHIPPCVLYKSAI